MLFNPDILQAIDDATFAMNDPFNDASTLLDKNVPLGEFLDEQIAKAKDIENTETNEIFETDVVFETGNYGTHIRPSSPRYELPEIPKGYVMDGEVPRDFLACKDRDGLMQAERNFFEC